MCRRGALLRSSWPQGGRLNATTWFDRTNYFETVPTGALDLALWLEADRHGHLLDAVNQANLDNQRDVVKEEKRQRYDNVPYGNALRDSTPRSSPRATPITTRPSGRWPTSTPRPWPTSTPSSGPTTAPTTPCSPWSAISTPEDGIARIERYFADLPAIAHSPRPNLPQLDPLS
jgi:zinc protease